MKNIAKIMVGGVMGATLLFPFITKGVDEQKTNTPKKSTSNYEIVVPYHILKVGEVREEAIKAKAKDEAAVQKKIALLGDKQKQNTAHAIGAQLKTVNQAWTDHFTLVLIHLRTITQKMQSRAGKAAATGQNITEFTAQLTKTETAIEDAEKAVEDQAQKLYLVDVTTITANGQGSAGQATLRSQLQSSFQKERADLYQDLFNLRDGKMKDARAMVQDTFTALEKIPHVDQEPSTKK